MSYVQEPWLLAPQLSGLPSAQRQRIWLMNLQLFVDESGKDTPPFFIMGGFLAPVAVWAKFSDEWNEILGKHPSVPHIHTAEAMALKGAFGVWSEAQRDERFSELSALINRSALGAILVVVRHDDYETVFKGKIDRKFDRPYMLTALECMGMGAELQSQLAIDGSIDVIFDEQLFDSDNVQDYWTGLQRVLPPSLKETFPNRPVYRRSKDLPPLQAADMFLWAARRSFTDPKFRDDKLNNSRFPVTKTLIEAMTKDSLIGRRDDLIQSMLNGGGLPYYSAAQWVMEIDRITTANNSERLSAQHAAEVIELDSFGATQTKRFRLVRKCADVEFPHLHRQSGNACLPAEQVDTR